ncbi:hypothetical protein [Clostridium fungisolvens]|uniref:Uncharacterized protein n=1 Tax=Clostridium fungisolvens TaxID=1604897 RepID=A0A6V8SE90_9CLOT|nr:hypothetical protein [Clostridium fungisolvens]GFP75527.1 hypothetical protein bsdtw1_01611 [Clostridium fungisolvens]
MKFNVKKVKLSKKRELDIYIPLEVPRQLTAIDPVVWDIAILGDSVAYKYLKKLFIAASNLKSQEIIYIPTYPNDSNEYRDIWSYGIFDMDIVLVNYHSTQLKAKDIFNAINTKNSISEHLKDINIKNSSTKYPEDWLTDRRLNARRFKNTLIIYTNRDVFIKFAFDTEYMTVDNDDEQYNFNVHLHEDLIGTSKDNGFNFLYYHKKENVR